MTTAIIHWQPLFHRRHVRLFSCISLLLDMVGRRAAPSVTTTSDDIVDLTAIAITTGEGSVEWWIVLGG